MKKKIVIALLLSAILSAAVLAEAATRNLYLSFNGDVACCTAKIKEAGKSIAADLSLWQGGTMLASWSACGMGSIEIQEYCAAPVGLTYTLKLNGTINGVSFSEIKVIKTNYAIRR